MVLTVILNPCQLGSKFFFWLFKWTIAERDNLILFQIENCKKTNWKG
jgi:hypothetical protein